MRAATTACWCLLNKSVSNETQAGTKHPTHWQVCAAAAFIASNNSPRWTSWRTPALGFDVCWTRYDSREAILE